MQTTMADFVDVVLLDEVSEMSNDDHDVELPHEEILVDDSTPSCPNATGKVVSNIPNGRPLNEIWDLFDKLKVPNTANIKVAKCKFCSTLVAPRPNSTMRKHISIDCKKCAQNSLDWEKYGLVNERIRGIISGLSKRSQDLTELFVARFIIGCGLPFSITDHKLFRDLLHHLQPGSKLPSRRNLVEQIMPALLKAHEEHIASMLVPEKLVTIALDGWSTRANEGIYGISLCFPDGKETLYCGVATGSERVTGRFLANMLVPIIETIGPKRVLELTTDSAANCKLLRSLIKDEFGHIYSFDCFVYILNTLCKDLLGVGYFRTTIAACSDIA